MGKYRTVYQRCTEPITVPAIQSGRVLRINPALITILEHIPCIDTQNIRMQVLHQTENVLRSNKVQSVHVDINVADYQGFGQQKPILNYEIFDFSFLQELGQLLSTYSCGLNLHLLTADPCYWLEQYQGLTFDAICYQWEVIPSAAYHRALLQHIAAYDACPSPVLEMTRLLPAAERGKTARGFARERAEALWRQLGCELPPDSMLTFQVEATGSRSHAAVGGLYDDAIIAALAFFRDVFPGTLQVQGGITTATVKQAVKLGMDFAVCGTQIFGTCDRNPAEIVERLLKNAAEI